MIGHFQSVGMGNPTFFISEDPRAAFFGEFFSAVPGAHLLFGEVADGVVEVHRVQREKLSEEFRLDLHTKVHVVPVEKTAFEAPVAVIVAEKAKTLFLV